MAREIRALTRNDVPELSQFLTAGFQAPRDADFAAPEVLCWKYLQPSGTDSETAPDSSSREGRDIGNEPMFDQLPHASSSTPRSFIARNESGQIIGHLGLCRTTFEGQMLAAIGGRVSTIHIIDWLGSPDHRSVGISLMRKAHEGVQTQFGLGVSPSALVVGERAGYELRSLVPVYSRVLRVSYWLRAAGLTPMERLLRLSRDVMRRITKPMASSTQTVVLKRTTAFGSEIDPIVTKAKAHAILTQRDPVRLNEILCFPRQAMSGWHLLDDTGRLRGLAVLNLIPKDEGRTCAGKIVDCLLDVDDEALWYTSLLALTHELAIQGADVAQAYASTPWTEAALRRSGYTSRFAVKFHIRDRERFVPRNAVFHLTPLEGDYAYT
jgi:hypothetical protein